MSVFWRFFCLEETKFLLILADLYSSSAKFFQHVGWSFIERFAADAGGPVVLGQLD